MNPIHIAPNRPLYLKLADPQGDSANYNFALQLGTYHTADGRSLQLPRPAVLLLNNLSPAAGEELVITKVWSGKPTDAAVWTIALSNRTENDRAKAEAAAQDPTDRPPASIEPPRVERARVAPPTPIRSRTKEAEQPRLFDHNQHQYTCNSVLVPNAECNCIGPRRGTGTDGPAPVWEPALLPARPRAVARRQPPAVQIPANIAVREVLQFMADDPNTRNWSDQARQDLASTIIIAAYKAGHIGLWERSE